MVKLIINEWVKLFKRTSTFVMIGFLILGMIGMGAIYKYLDNQSSPETNENWQEELETTIAEDREFLAELQSSTSYGNLQTYYERDIALNEYRLQNNIAPTSEQTIWTFVNDATSFISISGIFTIIIAAGIVASEFTSGTIKFLLVRPISRVKILLSKYITVILFGLSLLIIVFLFSSLIGALLFGFPSEESFHLAYHSGEVIERNIVFHLITHYLLYSIDILMIATMAFMISSVFRNNSLAIGFSLFLFFSGAAATLLLAEQFDWAKYILFSNTDLSVYFDGIPQLKG